MKRFAAVLLASAVSAAAQTGEMPSRGYERTRTVPDFEPDPGIGRLPARPGLPYNYEPEPPETVRTDPAAPSDPGRAPDLPRRFGEESADPAEVGVLSDERVDKEFVFLRDQLGRVRESVLPSLQAQTEALLAAARFGTRGDAVEFLLAEIQKKRGLSVEATLSCLELLYEFPGSRLSFNAKRMIDEIAGDRFKREREQLAGIAKGPRLGLGREKRLAALLERLAEFNRDDFYAPTVEAFRSFFKRYPGFEDSDALSFSLAALHARQDAPRSAVFHYERVLALSSKRPLMARTQSAVGDLYAGPLNDPEKAVGAYQSLAEVFRESEEAKTAYGRWARLLDEKLKQPMLAVDVLEKAVQSYPGTDAAHDALSESARILLKRLKNPARAVETLERLADMFPGERAVVGLRRAADIHGDVRDFAAQARTLIRISRRYPEHSFASEALWAAGRLYDKKLSDETAARRVFHDLIDGYPKSDGAEKARRRLESLE
ncbi:MAG: hypothetical protein AUJ52_05730 [Elusimicrobia bacterium CG1_02_63_36]|nr:MAG: hypothetical protein AUJ52_05730 [Elusimicrobia bacterium CG1_02_63_36]